MKPIFKKLLKYNAIDRGVTETEVLDQWVRPHPHFDMTAGHRYQGKASEYIDTKQDITVCVYCLRPQNLNNEKED